MSPQGATCRFKPSQPSCPPRPDADRSFSVSWSATDGFDEISPDKSFIAFDDSAYRAMRDDQSRTPLFQEAITRRLSSEACTVLDVGTGPFALLAIMAARAGATKVYACEANPEAAKRAREAVKNAKDVPSGVIEVHHPVPPCSSLYHAVAPPQAILLSEAKFGGKEAG
mmetsp:Transcript_39800/g.89135  ORF Transcript_39800/g.89135 Transcript_39800/m.89135 type:complete len:169 (+) Transcript_39800:67-573(+)